VFTKDITMYCKQYIIFFKRRLLRGWKLLSLNVPIIIHHVFKSQYKRWDWRRQFLLYPWKCNIGVAWGVIISVRFYIYSRFLGIFKF
jgi:hypothetical protein